VSRGRGVAATAAAAAAQSLTYRQLMDVRLRARRTNRVLIFSDVLVPVHIVGSDSGPLTKVVTCDHLRRSLRRCWQLRFHFD